MRGRDEDEDEGIIPPIRCVLYGSKIDFGPPVFMCRDQQKRENLSLYLGRKFSTPETPRASPESILISENIMKEVLKNSLDEDVL